jgi:hypothetical protein
MTWMPIYSSLILVKDDSRYNVFLESVDDVQVGQVTNSVVVPDPV